MDHSTVKVTVKCFDQVNNPLMYTILMEYRPKALTMEAIESLFILCETKAHCSLPLNTLLNDISRGENLVTTGSSLAEASLFSSQ